MYDANASKEEDASSHASLAKEAIDGVRVLERLLRQLRPERCWHIIARLHHAGRPREGRVVVAIDALDDEHLRVARLGVEAGDEAIRGGIGNVLLNGGTAVLS